MDRQRWGRWARRATLRYLAEDARSGYGDAADRLVRALRGAGVPIEYRGWNGDATPPQPVRHSRDPHPRARAPRDAPTIVHLVPEHYPHVAAALPDSPLVAHTVWETDRIPEHWPGLLRGFEQVVVPTTWNQAVFEASGIAAPVVVVPHVACDPTPGDRGAPLELPDDVTVFYTIARWDERKAPAAVIQAFLEAFTADDPVALVVKTTPHVQYPPPTGWATPSRLLGTTLLEIARITSRYPRPPLVRVEVDDWTPDRVAGLHHRGDCYVSLSHGEGWGLGAFDAAAYGNPVVITGWGGPLAYLDPDAAFLVEYDLEPVQHHAPEFYGPRQRWAVPRLEHGVALLREVAASPTTARRRAAPLQTAVREGFAPARVAEQFLTAVPAAAPDPGRASAPRARPSETGRRDVSDAPQAGDPGDMLLLVGLAVGPTRAAFDNWIEMAERYGYRYELLRRADEPYVAHYTKWRLLVEYFEALPRDQLVFHVDVSDAFVCDDAAQTLARYRSYRRRLVMGAEDCGRQGSFDVPDRRWCHANAGVYVGEAGVVADALREGYALINWDDRDHVSDQPAMIRYLRLPEHRQFATVDHRRTIASNIKASPHAEELAAHRAMLEHGADHVSTSSVHFYGGNGSGYNAFAELYGLRPEALEPSGAFRRVREPV